MQTAYHPDWASAVRYDFAALPDSPDAQISATIHRMIRYIREDAQTPFLKEEARKMLALGNGDPNQGVWNLLKPAMKFKRDEKLAEDLQTDDARKEESIEVLIRPLDQWLLIQMRGLGIGDCDCFSMYGACLLEALNVPCSLVTVAAEPDLPGQFSHVYLASYFNGNRVPLDISHGEYPGWECPNLGRLKEWKVNLTRHESLCDSVLVIGALVGAYFGVRYLTERAA